MGLIILKQSKSARDVSLHLCRTILVQLTTPM